MLKKIISLILVSTVLLQGLSSAQAYSSPASPARDSFLRMAKVLSQKMNYRSRLDPTNRLKNQTDTNHRLGSALKSHAAETMGEAGRTWLLLVILSGAEIVRHQLHQSQLKGESLSAEQLSSIAGPVAARLVDSGDVWMSMVSAGAVGGIMKKPLSLVHQIIEKNLSKSILKTLVQSGIVSVVTFVGWDLGGQLWNEARLLITDPSDYAKSEGMWSTCTAGVFSQNAKTELRICKLVFSNIIKVALLDDQLRSQWFYNTWRLRIASGDFVVLVTSMVTAGAVGTALFPGAGTILGLTFGLVGGVVAMSIPQETKDQLSLGIKNLRRTTDEFLLADNLVQIKSDLNTLQVMQTNSAFDRAQLRAQMKVIASDLRHRSEKRSDLVTVHFERLAQFQARVDQNMHENLVIAHTLKTHPNNETNLDRLNTFQENEVQIKSDEREFSKGVGQMLTLYQNEKLKIAELYRLNVAGSLGLIKKTLTQVILLKDVMLGLKESLAADAQDSALGAVQSKVFAVSFIKQMNDRGFDEQTTVDLWYQANQILN